jgi:hypothetical protein
MKQLVTCKQFKLEEFAWNNKLLSRRHKQCRLGKST